MDTSLYEDIAAYKRMTIDYDQIRATIKAIAKSIEDNVQEKIMDATIYAAGNDDAAISMAMAIIPAPDALSIIGPDDKYTKPVYYFRSEHGTELDDDAKLHLTFEMGYLLKQYEIGRDERYAPGVIFDICDKYLTYFTILCVIDYDNGDIDEVEFSDRAEDILLTLRKSINNALSDISNENLEVTHWGTFDGLPLVECIRR